MGVSVDLDKMLIDAARSYSVVRSRSVAKQIEHWAKIGHIAEENPDLNYEMIQGILLGLEDLKNGKIEEYHPGSR